MERLSTLDVSNLRVADRGLPMHVAALVILGGAAPGARLDPDTAPLAAVADQAPMARRCSAGSVKVEVSRLSEVGARMAPPNP